MQLPRCRPLGGTASFAAATALLTMGSMHPQAEPLQLPASTFGDLLWPRSISSEAFRGLPLGDTDINMRSAVLTTLVRGIDAQRHPQALFEEPVECGTRVDGRARSMRQAAYNWRRDGRRIACKSATLSFDQATDRWLCNFQKIKLGPNDNREGAVAFDELLLALYTPRGVYVYRHELGTHLQKSSSKSRALTALKTYGAKGVRDWAYALDDSILPKLSARCDALAFVSLHDVRLQLAVEAQPDSVVAAAFCGVPLADLSVKERGKIVKDIVRAVDECCHPSARFGNATAESADQEFDAKSNPCGRQASDYAWLRNKKCIACKGSQLSWERTQQVWKFQFRSVKLALPGVRKQAAFDELLLALYTPRGIYIYRHNLKLGVSTAGKATASVGHTISLYGARRQGDWQAALDECILPKLDAHCKSIAFVPFEHGGVVLS